jgi:hypothetical protein
MAPETFGFDFNFEQQDRTALLHEADKVIRGLTQELGPGNPSATVEEAAATRLLKQLDQEVARFGEHPEVLQLTARDFTEHGLEVPVQFADLEHDYCFYWTRIPLVLKPLDGQPFVRLKCALEFNPGADAHLRPRARMILPDRKFKTLLEVNDSVELRIGENFEFEPSLPKLPIGTASVEAKAAAKLGLVAGPFTYRLRRAQVDHSPAGSATVFWSLEGSEFFQESDQDLIVVLQVARGVTQVRIAAALQAYHSFRLLSASLGELISYVGRRLTNFFQAGAPVEHTIVWDISPNLSPCEINSV